MGPADNLTLGLNLDSTSLSVPKLHDDGSNWADYEPRVERALGAKGLWRHIVGTAIVPKPYAVVAGVPLLTVGITQASDDQVELKESKIADYNKQEYLAQHIILSTTSMQLGIKLKKPKNREGNVGRSQNGCHIEEYPVYPRCRRSVVQHEARRQ